MSPAQYSLTDAELWPKTAFICISDCTDCLTSSGSFKATLGDSFTFDDKIRLGTGCSFNGFEKVSGDAEINTNGEISQVTNSHGGRYYVYAKRGDCRDRQLATLVIDTPACGKCHHADFMSLGL